METVSNIETINLYKCPGDDLTGVKMMAILDTYNPNLQKMDAHDIIAEKDITKINQGE